LPYINGDKKIIKRYKGTQLVYQLQSDFDLGFEFSGNSLTFKLNGVNNYTATTSPYKTMISNLGIETLTSTYQMFRNCSGLTKILSIPDTSNVVRMESMFTNCSGLTSLDVSSMVIDKTTTIDYIFSGCMNLTEIKGLENWNTSNLDTLNYIFPNCRNLTSLNIGGWNVNKVTYLTSVFQNCSGLTSLDLSSWRFDELRFVSNVFQNCSSLETLDLSGWDVSNAQSPTYLFDGCSNLKTLNVSGWNTSNFDTPDSITRNFRGCTSLNRLILGNCSQETYNWWFNSLAVEELEGQVTIEYTIV